MLDLAVFVKYDWSMEYLKYYKIKLAGYICALTVIFSLVISCGGGGSSDSAKITLEFWQFWTDPDAKATVTSLIEDFQSRNPDTEVNVTDLTWGEGHSKIVVAFSSGNPPDIIELGSDWIPEFSNRGALYDISGFTADIRDKHIMWDPGIFGGKYYAVPWLLDTRVIFYNIDLMNRAGVSFEDATVSWDEFLFACQKVNGLGKDIAGFGANSFEKHRLYKKFLPFLWSAGGEVIDRMGESSLDSPEALSAFEYYLNLVKYGAIDTQSNLDQRFISGKLGFNFSGGWLLKNIHNNNPELNFGVITVPTPDGEMGISFAGGEYLALSSRCAHPEAAARFIKFLADPENTARLCETVGFGFPSTKQLPDDPFYTENRNRMLFHEQLLNSRMPPAHEDWVYIEEVIEKMVERGMYRKGEPAELLKQAETEISKILNR
ncbi:MAG: extracellular solute-binding protein [candidate division Zixibacteria bacterium]|nr:extracellular solute-binding protein [candidate division Zixibacteria bacterium]